MGSLLDELLTVSPELALSDLPAGVQAIARDPALAGYVRWELYRMNDLIVDRFLRYIRSAPDIHRGTLYAWGEFNAMLTDDTTPSDTIARSLASMLAGECFSAPLGQAVVGAYEEFRAEMYRHDTRLNTLVALDAIERVIQEVRAIVKLKPERGTRNGNG